MDPVDEDDSSGPSSLSSDQASLCVIPDPDESSEEDGFIYVDKTSLPGSLDVSEHDRAIIVFHSVDEEYPANRDIVCQYIRPDGWEENFKDNICLFKVGWVTKNDATFIISPATPSKDPIGRVIIPEDILPKDSQNLYQFCYMREYTLLGASTPFQFVHPSGSVYKDGISQMSSSGGKSVENKHEYSEHAMKDRGTEMCASNSEVMGASQGNDHNCMSIHSQFESYAFDESIHNHFESSPFDAFLREPSTDGKPDEIRGSLYASSGDNRPMDLSTALKDTDKSSSETGKAIAKEGFSMTTSNCSAIGTKNTGKSFQDEKDYFIKLLHESNMEKAWFQKQYFSMLDTAKNYAETLNSERLEKESLSHYLSELSTSHKKVCCENERLQNELEAVKQDLKDQTDKWEHERKMMKKQLQDVSFENNDLRKHTDCVQSQIKKEGEVDFSSECQCEKYQKQVEDLTERLSDYDVLKACLEVELEEEIKLGKERDLYLCQLEQVNVNNLHMTNNWLSSTPTSLENGSTLLKMEENISSILEALERTLKEMEVLRTRKAAVNKANRILREDYIKKKVEWEDRLMRQKKECEGKINDLKSQLECERDAKLVLKNEMENLKEMLHQCTLKTAAECKNCEPGLETRSPKIEPDCEREQPLGEREGLPREKAENREETQDMESLLLNNLKEARDEYKKLYTEKHRIQEKLTRLQQKIRAKKVSKSQQEAAPNSPKADFMDIVSPSWRAMIDELM